MPIKAAEQPTASILLAHELTSNLPFLQRNLTKRLDSLEIVPPKQSAGTRPDPRPVWDPDIARFFATPEMTEVLTPKLKVTINGIVPAFARRRIPQEHADVHVHTTRRSKEFINLDCKLIAEIFSSRVKSQCVFWDWRIIRLCGARGQDGRFNLKVALAEGSRPLLFQMQQIMDRVYGRSGGWRIGMADSYTMTFRLEFRSSKDTEDVFEALRLNPDAVDAQLRATWGGLPKCPTRNQLLPLFLGDATTSHSLDVSMGWGTEAWIPRKRPSLGTPTPEEAVRYIKRYNQETQLPTPATTPSSSTGGPEMSVSYYMAGTEHTVSGLRCFLCKSRNHSSIDRLRFHFSQIHPTLSIQVREDSQTHGLDLKYQIAVDGKQELKSLRVMGRSRLHENKAKHVYEEIDFSASHQVTNLENALNGILEDLVTPPAQHEVSVDRFLTLEDLRAALPPQRVNRAPLPQHPLRNQGVSYLSIENKSTLEAGQIYADEDEVIDESSLHLRSVSVIRSLGLTPIQEELTILWNEQVRKELPKADIFVGGTAIRFVERLRMRLAKRQQGLSAQSEVVEAVLAFLSRTSACGYLDKRLMLQYQREIKTEDWTEIVPSSETSDSGDEETAQADRKHGDCKCGKTITSYRTGVIYCSNPACEYPNHHRACAGLSDDQEANKAKALGWLCSTCSKGKQRAGRTSSNPYSR